MEDLYQNFISKLKIKQLRAEYNGQKETGEKYKKMCKQLEEIRERRHLGLLGEKREESVIYNKILETLNAKGIEDEAVEEVEKSVQNLLRNVQYSTKENQEKPKEEIEVEI